MTLTVQDLVDAAADVATIEEIVESSNLTTTTRQGSTIKTWAGVQADIAAQGNLAQNNLTAIVDPAVTDDADAGYSKLSRWINTDTGAVFMCTDATAGAAVWVDISASGTVADGSITTAKLADSAVTLAKLADIAQNTFLARATAGAGAPEALTAAQVRTVLNIADGADVTNATSVNAAGAVMETDYNASTILAADANNTPLPLTVAASRFVGRKATGGIVAMTAAEARAELNVADGATADDLEAIPSDLIPDTDSLRSVGSNLVRFAAGFFDDITLTNALAVQYGGTGAATLASGEVLLGNGTGAVQSRAIGIADTNIVRIDGASNAPVTGDYAHFTASGLEGLSAAEVLADIGAAASGHNHDGTYVPVARTVTAGEGLSGGGALSSNISLALALSELTVDDGTILASADWLAFVDADNDNQYLVTIANFISDQLNGVVVPASHNHAASEITSGTLAHERGGLEADVSAYDGLVGITGGSAFELQVAASRFVGRKSTGAIAAMTPAEALTELSGQAGAAFSFNGQRVTNAATPTSASDLATKAYVDGVVSGGIDAKESVEAVAASNVTLSGEQTIDGVTTSTSRVLLIGQSAGAENGIYVTAAGAWSRAEDADEDAEVTSGLYTFCTGGTVYGNTGWLLTTADPITVDTTALSFVQFTSLGQVTDGVGILKTGNTLSLILSELPAESGGGAPTDYLPFTDTSDADGSKKVTVADFIVNAGILDTSDIGSLVQGYASELDDYVANPLTTAELGQLQNIGATTISAAQWGYLGALDQSLAQAQAPTFAGVNLSNGGYVRTGQTAGNTFKLQGRDVDGATWVDFLTVTAGNTPTADLSAAVTIGGQGILDDSDIGATVQAYSANLDIYAANALTAAEIQQLQNINATTVSTAQWGYLGGMDQAVATTASPDFAGLTVGGVTVATISGAQTLTNKGIDADNNTITNIGTAEFDTDTADSFLFLVGNTLDSVDVGVSSNGTTISLSLEKSGGGDVRYFFTDGIHTHDCTPADTVALTAGTDASPQINYVYILQSTKALTASTSGWPAGQHARVATVLCQSAASLQTDGAYKVHVWSNHVTGADQGHLAHQNAWIREQPATWISGVALTPSVTTNGGAEDNIDIASAAGVVLQLHDHAFPAFDTSTGSEIYIINYSGAAYTKVTDLNAADQDDAGNAIANNQYTSVVIWGVVSEDSADCKLMLNLPSGFYTNEAAAIADTSRYTNYLIPSVYTGTGFLIARLVLKYTTAGSGTWEVIANQDLRGQIPSIAAGGALVASTEFADNVFRIYDDADPSREIAFALSGLTALRTITVPDADITLADAVALASTANGAGASLIGIEDSGGLITATTVEGALAENRAAIDAIEADYWNSGNDGAGSGLDADLLDGQQGSAYALLATLASVSNGDGAALIGIEDAGGYLSAATVEAALQEIAADVAALGTPVSIRGTWDASSGSFPGGGTAQSGYTYIVSVGGTVDGVEFTANDRILAITDNASTTTYASNWHKLDYTDAVLSVAGKTGAVVLAAGDIASGTFADARISESSVTQHEAAISITESQISDFGTYATVASLASTSTGQGAALIGIEDSGGIITATTVEGALAENRAAIDAIEADYLDSTDIGATVQAYSATLDTYVSNALTAAELGQLQNIDSVTISNTQWGYLGGLDQALAAASTVQFANINVGHASDTTLSREAAGVLAVEGNTLANLDIEDQVVTGGAYVSTAGIHDYGTFASGTLTVDIGKGPVARANNNGAHTLAPPSGQYGTQIILYSTGASAGAITTSGFTSVTGDAFTTTNGDEFECTIVSTYDGTTSYSRLHVEALQ